MKGRRCHSDFGCGDEDYAGLVNELNTVDQAMIADGSCRLFTEEQDGYALWHDRTTTELVNNATKDLPMTEQASRFVLTA